MRNNSHPVDPHQRCAAVLVRVGMLFNGAECPFGKQRTQYGQRAFFNFPLNHIDNGFGKTFGHFQHDIPYETIANNYVRFAGVYVAPFQGALEVHADFAHVRNGVFNQKIPLRFFFPDGKNTHGGAFQIKHLFHISRTHDRKLQQVQRFAVCIGAAVQQQADAFIGRHRGSNSRTHNALNTPHAEKGSHHGRPGMPCGNKSIRLAFMYQIGTYYNAGALFIATFFSRFCPHIYGIGRVNNRNVRRQSRAALRLQFLFNNSFIPHQYHMDIKGFGCF